MMRGAAESWILEVEGALAPIEGGSGVVWPSRGANQELSSSWKVILSNSAGIAVVVVGLRFGTGAFRELIDGV